MARDSSFLQYMRAHGNTPGPTQRPLVTGAITGLIAFAPYEIVLDLSGARSSIVHGFGINPWLSVGIRVLEMILAGVLYAVVFKRAANDFHGGWLFGASFGFLLWMITPVALWQLFTGQPIVVGVAAMGLFGAYVLYGITLGLIFPWIHTLIQSRLNEARMEVAVPEDKSVVTPEKKMEK
ncbi:MAG TPA: hypothetical protein VEV84_05420 [Pyrinomonadaceae bacterium]|nr:hypothetical protein [Pyrinomonadaceae bacterium]